METSSLNMQVLFMPLYVQLFTTKGHNDSTSPFIQDFLQCVYLLTLESSLLTFSDWQKYWHCSTSEPTLQGTLYLLLSSSWKVLLQCEKTIHAAAAAAAAKSLQSCPTLCDPIDGSLPGSPIPGILQARTLEWVAISFSNAWKWKVKGKSLSLVRRLATPWTAAYQAPPAMGFSR